MRQENAGAERCNKRGRQLEHWKSPCTTHSNGPRDITRTFRDGFVGSRKWFRRLTDNGQRVSGRRGCSSGQFGELTGVVSAEVEAAASLFNTNTYLGSDGRSFVVPRDVQHRLLGDFILHLLRPALPPRAAASARDR
jgi:hypothetical protein